MYNTDTILVKRPEASNRVRVQDASYLDGYRLSIYFTDGHNEIVDFSEFIRRTKGYLSKYRKPSNFLKFKIDNGNVVWGNDWDMIFPIEQLYKGHIEL